MVAIDFSVFPAEDVIEVKKRQSTRIPIMVEAPRDADYALKLSVFRDDMMLPEAAGVSIDKESVALSSLDTPVTDIG